MPDWSQFQHQSFIWPKSVQFEAHLDIFSQIFDHSSGHWKKNSRLPEQTLDRRYKVFSVLIGS